MRNFLIVNTNIDGSRYYIMTYHFFLKICRNDYDRIIELDPSKELIGFTNEMYKQEKVNDKYIEETISTCSNFKTNKFLYIPHAICLLSKFPFVNQMETSLLSILKMLSNPNANIEEVNRFLIYLIKEIPLPPINKKLYFYIPNSVLPLELDGGKKYNLPSTIASMSMIFKYFSVENILFIHFLMLMEQKILFVGDEFYILTHIIETFTNLLYPIQ